MLPRKLKGSWLKTYLDYTIGQESPEIFHFWVGVSLIASTLGRNVFLDRGYFELYPNMYIVLLAEPEKCAKSTAIKIGRRKIFDLIENRPAVFAQKASPQALVETLVDETGEPDENGEVYENAEVVIPSSELPVFLGKKEKNTELLNILTDLYDSPDTWAYKTRFKGWEQVVNACVNILSASTPNGLRDAISRDAIAKGFVSRLVFVYVEYSDRVFAHPELTDEMKQLEELLIHDLSVMRRLKGPMKWGEGAKEWYSEWYKENHERMQNAPDKYVTRKKDLILKLAMCISVSKSNNMVLEVSDLDAASLALAKVERYLPYAMALLSSSTMGEDTRKVLELLRRRRKAKHSWLMSKMMHIIDAKRMSEILETLEQAGLVQGIYDAKHPLKGRYYEYVGEDKKELKPYHIGNE